MLTTNDIHDMIQTTDAGDTDRVLDILLDILEHVKAHERSITMLETKVRHPDKARDCGIGSNDFIL